MLSKQLRRRRAQCAPSAYGRRELRLDGIGHPPQADDVLDVLHQQLEGHIEEGGYAGGGGAGA